MITTRQMHLEMELIRWIILVLAAVALVLAAATLAAAADPMTEPRLLPGDMTEVAKPLTPATVQPFFPEAPPAREFPPAEAVARLWTIFEHQRAGCFADAIAGWEQLRLPEAAAPWRELGLAAAYLHAGDLEQAHIQLDIARRLAPEHAVVAYFMGILRLEQRADNGRLPDPANLERMRLVMFTPGDGRTNLEWLAIEELQQAIRLAPTIQLDQRLLATGPFVEEAVIVPRVCDLLAAIGADNFVGKAHQLLFGLHLDRGEVAAAEMNLDLATATGLAPLYGYRDLTEWYLNVGRNGEATRVLLKDIAANQPWLFRACDQLRQQFAQR